MQKDQSESQQEQPSAMSRTKLLLLAIATGVIIANAYYIHPLVNPIARHFGLSDAEIGLAPALNQIALAIGIFLLLPLGDRISNRRLVSICVTAQFLGVLTMAFAPTYPLFLAACAFLGFVTIAPYVLPAYVSKRVPAEKLGEINGVLTTGVILGILFARSGAGIIGEYFGWRAIYFIAAILMAMAAIALPRIMNDHRIDDATAIQNEGSYISLLGSIFPLVFARPAILLLSLIQGLNFGIFLVIWLAIGLHIPGELGYGVDVVGYLALLAIFNFFTTTPLGRWADRMGAKRARLTITLIQLAAICCLPFAGHSIGLLILPLIVINIVGPIVDVTGRMTLLSEPPEIRTRLMTVYIVFMFVGGGLASWAGTAIYGWGGWQATSLLAIGMSATVVTLSFVAKHISR